MYSFASTAIRKKCKTLQNKIQISFYTEKYKSCETALMLNKSIGAVFLFTAKEKSLYLWLSVHKEVLVSRIKTHYAFAKKPRKATALPHFLASA